MVDDNETHKQRRVSVEREIAAKPTVPGAATAHRLLVDAGDDGATATAPARGQAS